VKYHWTNLSKWNS